MAVAIVSSRRVCLKIWTPDAQGGPSLLMLVSSLEEVSSLLRRRRQTRVGAFHFFIFIYFSKYFTTWSTEAISSMLTDY